MVYLKVEEINLEIVFILRMRDVIEESLVGIL